MPCCASVCGNTSNIFMLFIVGTFLPFFFFALQLIAVLQPGYIRNTNFTVIYNSDNNAHALIFWELSYRMRRCGLQKRF
jgi:hypothetical protein